MAFRYDYAEYPGTDSLDLINVPRECITVTVSIADEKLKDVIEKRLTSFRKVLDSAVKAESWTTAARISENIDVLEGVLKDAGL